MTPANVRHHLAILLERKLIEPAGQTAPAGRGRPEHAYSLASGAKSNNFAALSSALLSEVGADNHAIRHIAHHLLGEKKVTKGQATQRLVGAMQQLTVMGYRPNWEARPQGPRVVLHHCPYAAIIAEHPELCRIDAAMLEELLGSPMEQTAKLQPGPQGALQCIFVTQPA